MYYPDAAIWSWNGHRHDVEPHCILADQPLLRMSRINGGVKLFSVVITWVSGRPCSFPDNNNVLYAEQSGHYATLHVCPDIGERVNTSNVATPGAWLSELDIYALATIVKRLLAKHRSGCHKSHSYQAIGDTTQSGEVIRIHNMSYHHDTGMI